MTSRLLIIFALLPFSAYGEAPAPIAADAFVKQVQPLLKEHCLSCHGPDVQEGGVGYDGLTDDKTALRRRTLWKRAVLRVRAGEMPPEGEKPLTADEKKTLVDWMTVATEHLDCSTAGDPGPTILRRLTRNEYDRTIRDLLGVDFRSAEMVGMPEEGVLEGFDNTSAALGFSPALLEKYLAAADKVLELLYSPRYHKQLNAVIFVRPKDDVTAQRAAQQIAERLIRRAYRGRIGEEDLRSLLALFQKATDRGEPFDQAVRIMLKPVLVAPRFLYRFEEGRPAKAGEIATRVTDHELAARLSYFLWSSLPDEELIRLADSGELSQPPVLREQTLRMVKDPKATALTDNFFVQWLQLRKLDHARPSTEFFPAFTHQLRHAMRQETLTFLNYVRQEDRSLLELLNADYTFVNADLAKHYGVTAPEKKDAFERVALRPEDHRGGLLGMGSILSMTSHTFRTSPTQRGKYILDVIFGSPVPPPPANAGMLKDDTNKRRMAITFREQLAQHATQKACVACHKKLDPLGFALDNYDGIGAWRVSTSELPLDVAGELPSGETFSGAAELKQLILARKDDFAKNLAGRLLSYSLGRELDYFDDCTIHAVGQRLKQRDYRFSELILGIVESDPFLNRRTEQ